MHILCVACILYCYYVSVDCLCVVPPTICRHVIALPAGDSGDTTIPSLFYQIHIIHSLIDVSPHVLLGIRILILSGNISVESTNFLYGFTCNAVIVLHIYTAYASSRSLMSISLNSSSV